MESSNPTWEDMRQDKHCFMTRYSLDEQALIASGYTWDELLEIGDDYAQKRAIGGEFAALMDEIYLKVSQFDHVHSCRYRLKDIGGLLEKIVRKAPARSTKITVCNYYREITDLLGVHILYVLKDDYWPIHQQIMETFGNQLTENIKLKLKFGDDKSQYSKILKKSGNKVVVEENETYRSIHYTMNARTSDINRCPIAEIQTRTIFEEGWSEINHQFVYKNDGAYDRDLLTLSHALSELVGTCDSLGGLMRNLYDAKKPNAGNDDADVGHDEHASLVEALSYNEALRRMLNT